MIITIVAIYNEIWRHFTFVKRYPFNTFSSLAASYIVFLALFHGIRFIGEGAIPGEKLDAIVIGYLMWNIAIFSFSDTAGDIFEEAKMGTLEQLYLSPLGFYRISFYRMIAGYIYLLIFNAIVLFAAMLTTGRWLNIPVLEVILLITISVPAMHGIGFILGGIALVAKKVHSLSNIFYFAIIFLVSLPTYPVNAFSFLPFAPGANTIMSVIVYDANYPVWWYLFISINSLFYFACGIYCFQ